MKKFCVLFFCLSSMLLGAEPAKDATIQEKESSLVVQNIMENQENAPLVSPFPHYFRRMLLSLGLLVGLLILTVWALKRLMRSREKEINEQKKIKIIEKRVLSSKSLLYLVEVDGERVLLSESHLEIRPLKALEKEEKN